MTDSKYCYPNTDILINHFGIQDKETLEKVERDFTSVNIAALTNSPAMGNFDLNHLCEIHYRIFGDIYPFAGQIRNVAIAKSNLFCLPQFIIPMAGEIFTKLHQENCLHGLGIKDFIERLAFYSGEINALHPFREGNGRTQRIFLQELSRAAGYQFFFAGMDKQMLLHADIEAMSGRYGLLEQLYAEGVRVLEHGINQNENKLSVLEQIKNDRENPRARENTAHRKAGKKKGDTEI